MLFLIMIQVFASFFGERCRFVSLFPKFFYFEYTSDSSAFFLFFLTGKIFHATACFLEVLPLTARFIFKFTSVRCAENF